LTFSFNFFSKKKKKSKEFENEFEKEKESKEEELQSYLKKGKLKFYGFNQEELIYEDDFESDLANENQFEENMESPIHQNMFIFIFLFFPS